MLVRTERRNQVEVIAIDRPEARNAIDYATSKALADTFDAVEVDPDVGAVVLTGAGDKAFSAGMDLKAFAGAGGHGLVQGRRRPRWPSTEGAAER